MKKILAFVLAVSVMTLALIGCTVTPSHFSGEWHFSEIKSVEIVPDTPEYVIDILKQTYSAEDEDGIIAGALAAFTADNTFASCYLKFDTKYTYTYDPVMDREATWVFYKTGDNTGFISFYTELDAAEGNPDPINNPDLVYDAQSNTMLMTINYISFMVTLELSR